MKCYHYCFVFFRNTNIALIFHRFFYSNCNFSTILYHFKASRLKKRSLIMIFIMLFRPLHSLIRFPRSIWRPFKSPSMPEHIREPIKCKCVASIAFWSGCVRPNREPKLRAVWCSYRLRIAALSATKLPFKRLISEWCVRKWTKEDSYDVD